MNPTGKVGEGRLNLVGRKWLIHGGGGFSWLRQARWLDVLLFFSRAYQKDKIVRNVRMAKEISSEVPQHVGIIMDGNGRWAKQRGKPRLHGHRNGVINVRRVLEEAKVLGVPYVTLFAFSVENWSRPPVEVRGLMALLREFLRRETKNMVRDGIRLRVIGDFGGLPPKVQAMLTKSIEMTRHNDDRHLTLALNYGSRAETIEAVKRYAKLAQLGEADPDELDWKEFSNFLYTADLPDPDLIIRTSGENRLSNFLLLQGAYAEIYMTSVLWPEFDDNEFRKAVESYGQRERRFGKTGEQIQSEKTKEMKC
ncbi:MAG: polyprenyl diphosphate synthase [Opitutales bacterium]|jgi:undecaprenyl diphosphate synthase